MDILGDCGSPDPGSIPGPGPCFFFCIYGNTMINCYSFTGMAESIPVVIGFLIAIYYVDRIGRRFLLIIGFLGSFAVLVLFFFVNQYMVVGLLMTFSAFGFVHFFHNVGPVR